MVGFVTEVVEVNGIYLAFGCTGIKTGGYVWRAGIKQSNINQKYRTLININQTIFKSIQTLIKKGQEKGVRYSKRIVQYSYQ